MQIRKLYHHFSQAMFYIFPKTWSHWLLSEYESYCVFRIIVLS